MKICNLLVAGMLAPALLLMTGCDSGTTESAGDAAEPSVVIAERWMSPRNEDDNVDSVALWRKSADENLVFATAKSTDVILVLDARNGQQIDRIGGTGNAPGRLLRPNAVAVADDLLWIVERDNRRLQVLSLPDYQPLLLTGSDVLTKPYGLWVQSLDDGWRVFVTDSYETEDKQVPPDEQLDRRLHRFDIERTADGSLKASHAGGLGPTTGDGRLLKVESLWGDPVHDRLLVADEHESRINLKVFDLEGRFQRTLGNGILRHEPEGIALYSCADGSGLWIVTDQDPEDNRFVLFDRVTLEHVGEFRAEKTRHTDGVWLHNQSLPGFDLGVFLAIHNDGNVAALDWQAVMQATQQSGCD